jgi:hypothetical protein
VLHFAALTLQYARLQSFSLGGAVISMTIVKHVVITTD